MEALYQSFMAIPIDSVGMLGLVQIVFITVVVIFKLVIPAPRKKSILINKF